MKRFSDEPNMSDATLLLSVEDLISRAMGPPDVNIVNFKLIQMILHILARQQRMLKQRVEIKVTELATVPQSLQIYNAKSPEQSTESSSSKSPRSPAKRRMADIKEEREKEDKLASVKKKEKEEQKEMERAERSKLKETEKAQKIAHKEKEKTEKIALKEQEKAEKLANKEKEKAVKVSQKEQEKAEKAAQKDREKAKKAALKEQENAEKKEKLEKEKTEKQARKEKEKIERMTEKEKLKEAEKAAKIAEKEKKQSAKEQEKAEKEKARAEREEERERLQSRSKSPGEEKKKAVVKSDISLSIKESKRGKENVIVVEKGPTTRRDSRSRTNIDVVTQSQFALLETAVRQLKEVAVPQPLALPDNRKLRSDVAKGTASLTDTMQAMQVGARVKAAETAIGRMTGILTKLAAAGALPEDLVDQVERVAEGAVVEPDGEPSQAKSRVSIAPRKSVFIDPKTSQTSRLDARPSVASHVEGQPSVPSAIPTPKPSQITIARPSILSKFSTVSLGPGVTHEEMNSALRTMREEISKNLQGVVGRAATSADSALHTAMNVANKLDIALKLDVRISSLFSIVSDYAEQLSGFDAGLTTQMQSFKDQIGQMRTDLQSGLAQLENVNNNAETAAVMELTERYTELVGDLDTTLNAHNALQQLQGKLGDEMHSLDESVEMLREQKCDRDEVLDGLRDKADISRLSGLLSEVTFAAARADIERRLDLCHDKFRRQDSTWATAIKDLTRLTDQKAELIELLSLRDLALKQLQDLHERLRALAFALGEPKAALLMRQMCLGASCGACGVAALMEPCDPTTGIPPSLPPLRAEPEVEPCERLVMAEPPLDRHACHRYVGGSHTALSAAAAPSAPRPPPASRQARPYIGYGNDGRLYMMEEELKPCIECNAATLDGND